MVLVSVKVQCVKVRFLMKNRKVVLTITRTTFANNNKNCDLVVQCLVRARIAFHTITSVALTEQGLMNNAFFVACTKVSVVII